MGERDKFKRRDAETLEEKLIVRIENSLLDVWKAEIKLISANPDLDKLKLYQVIRDGALAFAGNSIEFLTRMLDGKHQIKPFLDECDYIFQCYLRQAREMNEDS